MRAWPILRVSSVLLMFLVLMTSAVCRENDRTLLGDYRFVRMYDTACEIVYRTEESVVPANVVEYAVVGDLIVGQASADGLSPAARELTHPGFFIIDTKGGAPHASTRLDRDAWLQELKLRGIQESPQLERCLFR